MSSNFNSPSSIGFSCQSSVAEVLVVCSPQPIRAEQATQEAARRLLDVAALFDPSEMLCAVEDARSLQILVDRVAIVIDAQVCSIMLVVSSPNRLRVAASHGLPPEGRIHTQLLEEGIAGHVVHSMEPLLISKALASDPRLHNMVLKPGFGSAILVPIKDRDYQVLGVLCIRRRPEKADFTVDEVKLASVFASQAALALIHTRLVKDLECRTGELRKISTLTRTLLTTSDLDTLLHATVEEICRVAGCDRCCLYWREANKPILTPRLFQGFPESVGRNPVKIGEGAVGHAAHTKTILHFDSQAQVDVEEAQSLHYRKLNGYARSLGTDSFIAIPILNSKGTCIGVFVADNKLQRLPISIEQRDLLQVSVNQAAIAIENALLYEQMQDNVFNLRRLKDYTDNVLQSIEAAILTTDGQGHIVRCNRAAEVTLQCAEMTLRDVPVAEALTKLRLPQEEADKLLASVLHVLETGEGIHRLKLTIHPQDRPTMTVYLMVSRLPDHKPERTNLMHSSAQRERAGIVIVFEDVTQEVRLESELEKMRRLADIGQLAAKMAHEVRNALSPIKGAAQIIRSEMETWQQEAAAIVEWPDMIIAEVDGLSRLTNEMLDFARPTPLDPHPIDINAFLQTALQSLSGFLEEHCVQLCWELEGNIPSIQVDVIQIGQVVRNLAMNAAQSMSDGGVLTVGSQLDEAQRMIALWVQDTGSGISPEDQDRIFRPFVTTRPKGTGLGLPIVQKIVDHHGGKVEVRSKIGEGTRFTIYLPLDFLKEEYAEPEVRGAEEEIMGRGMQRSERMIPEPPLIYDRPTGKFPDK